MDKIKKYERNKIFGKKIVFQIIAIMLGFLIALLKPPEGLSVQAMWTLGILAWVIVNWVSEAIPDYAAAMLMCIMWFVLGIVPFQVAFEAYGNTTWWLLVGALGISVGVSKSGLLKRASLMIMSIFPPTFKGQIIALLGSGVIISPLIPSTTAKVSIIAPLAMSIADALGFENKSKGRTGLFLAMFCGFTLIAPLFISATFLCYIVAALLPVEVQTEQCTWFNWFINMIPWALVVLTGFYFAITILYKPEKPSSIPTDYIKNQIIALGPMSRDEKITLAVLLAAICFWVTESLHGIPAVVPAVTGMAILLSFNIFNGKDIQMGIPWSLLIFIGAVMNLGTVLTVMKIPQWIGSAFSPFIAGLVGNPYLFIAGIAVGMYLIRFLIVDLIAAFTLFILVLVPFAESSGISPLVVGLVSLVSIQVWNTFYQNGSYLIAYAASGGEERIEFRHTVKMSVAYMIISFLGLLISVPYWQMLGIIQ